MTPRFQVTVKAPGQSSPSDITGLIADRLVSLTVTDEAGLTSDRLELVIDDRDGRIEMPPHKAVLEVALGLEPPPGPMGPRPSSLTPVGRFTVDSTAASGPRRVVTIEATAADLGASIRASRTRSFTGITMGDLVATIAGDYGLRTAVAEALSSHRFEQVTQNGESDINLITRLARGLDAVAKTTDGVLVVTPRGASANAAGEALPVVALAAGDLSDWRWRAADRETYKSVEARWRDVRAGVTRTISVGSGSPKRELRRVHATEAEARRAAQAALTQAKRDQTLDLTLTGFGAGCFAAGLIDVTGLKPCADGRWHLKRVEHVLRAGLVTTLNAEREG